MNGTYWKTTQAQTVRERAGKESLACLAERVGKSPSAVKQWANENGLSVAYGRKAPRHIGSAPIPPNVRAKAIELRESGWGLVETAKACGVSHTTVWRWCKP